MPTMFAPLKAAASLLVRTAAPAAEDTHNLRSQAGPEALCPVIAEDVS